MGNRQALIIAVPLYELSDRFPDLTETVGRDVELMTGALHSSGYSVECIGAAPGEPALRSRIRSVISRVCATAPEDGTVLIHFTGHGLSVDGADHLVPPDAQLTWATDPPEVMLDSLIGLDLAELLKGCRAGTVLLTVDACRDEPASEGASHGGPATNFPAWRERVAVLFGCGPGQTCGSDEENGSHFTRALADALHADTAPRTVADVIRHTVRRTAEFARSARQVQTPTAHYAPSGPDAIRAVELCAGRALHEEWATAVRDPELWAAVEGCTDVRRAELQRALVGLAGECAKLRGSALAGVPDPWTDDDYPVRVLVRGLRPLLAPSQTQGGPLLDAGEFAVLAAAPFVREAVYAMGVKEVTAVDPFRLDPDTGPLGREPVRVDLEHTFAAHALLWRKGRELAGRGREEDAEAVAAWLMHRHIGGNEQLWDTYAPQLLVPLAKALLGPDTTVARIEELADELVRVCRQTGVAPAEPYQGERENADTRWRVDELARTDGTVERWRPRELSWLIGVAGMLGGDLRQLPGVLVDNIGITDGLRPAEAVASVRELRWDRGRLSRNLDLDLPCPHPAVHAALETLTGWADDAVQNIRRHVAPAEPAALLAQLPERITCRRLRPQYDRTTKGDVYGVPLMRFGLAEDEMRELLMGTQLYGDPALALRELYQNALDACRYRQARLRYGKADGNVPYTWQGEIVFRQGVDEEGRPYVECEDNGVGMDRMTLRGTFSRAGRRFEQSREYRREQARWRRADPALRIYPNSRFGVGVFSYFMLADEISIWTRATDEYGRADSSGGLRVDVASTGSLFRIRRGEEAQPVGGTRVRLYLQKSDIDVAGELGKRVWRSEFGMRVENGEEAVRSWEKGALYYFGDAERPVPATPDAWWVEGKGCLLVDGILVDGVSMGVLEDGSARAWLDSVGRHRTSDTDSREWHQQGAHPFGFVVDLRETHAPDITTDRSRILSYDRSWVDAQLLQAADAFEAPEWLTLEWLWAFAQVHPAASVRVTELLLAADARITSRAEWDRTAVVDFRRVGCFPADAFLVRLSERGGARLPGSLSRDSGVMSWRAAALHEVGIELGSPALEALALPDTVEGYPAPEAWEARLDLHEIYMFRALWQAALPQSPDERVTLGELMGRMRRYVVAGLDVPAVTGLDGAHRMQLDATDCAILYSRGYFGGLVGARGPNPAREDVIDVLRRFSVTQSLSIREAMTRARRFAAAGFPLEVPENADTAPQDAIATREELAVLRWHPRFYDPDALLEGTAPAQDVYDEVLRRYAWLGWPTEGPVPATPPTGGRPGRAAVRDLPQSWTPEQRDEYTKSFGIRESTSDSELSLRQMARASGILALSMTQVAQRFQGVLASKALRVPELGDLGERVFTRLDSDLLGAVNGDFFDDAWLPAQAPCPASLLEVAQAVRRVQAPEGPVRERLADLADAGLVDERAPGLVAGWRAVTVGDWDLFLCKDRNFRSGISFGWDRSPSMHGIKRAVQGTAVRHGLDVFFALLAAAAAGITLGSAIERLLVLGPLLGLDVSPLNQAATAATSDLRPTPADLLSCCTTVDDVPRWCPRPDPALLVAHARDSDGTLGDSVTALTRYAPLGAPWQDPPETGAPWADHRPSAHDSALFQPDLVGDGPVGPLQLLRVAARFGWSLTRAWDRLALYRPFGLDLLVDRPEPAVDTVPTWRDLILLTEQYTGREPALTGEVTADRIAVAARELGRPTRWVYDRLALYASLFGLVLSAGPPAEPAPTPPAEPALPAADVS
ncbi:caspase family protein [Streptomyces sp. NBC_01275]|uniref:HD domain-containing protein n=1 Tax=Streptomyces sp. NBC_01275 TaxID=2903807 RepID=UPI00224DE12A|nr:caspase family protein [Streptomyces sp. NBC_01275]MCX4761008.1 caspase family protein [Streptomyces sp. NBC_01275]